MPRKRRTICFVTGTRAEFGLMRSVLEAIRSHPALRLQIVATGMHLHAQHGKTVDAIRAEGWKIDAVVPWKRVGDAPPALAEQTGLVAARLAKVFSKVKTDIVLITGDRVEAFAAAAAAHVSQRIIAHVHGGDRAAGQIDDSLRHAVSKLAHIHFPATKRSAQRLKRLGEDQSRIFCLGSPGIDGIEKEAASPERVAREFSRLTKGRFALILLHPVSPVEAIEHVNAKRVLSAILAVGIRQLVVVYPNNDPGSGGIIRCWREHRSEMTYLLKDIPRPLFLGLMRDAAMLVGNSSSGIIEAATFGTPVLDIGPRQQGRDRSQNVMNVPCRSAAIVSAARRIWNNRQPRRWHGRNIYGRAATGSLMASILGRIALDARLRRKLIAY